MIELYASGAEDGAVAVTALVSGLEGRHVFTYHIAHATGNYLVHGFHKKREAMEAMTDLQERGGVTHHLLCHEHEVHEMNDVLYVEFEPAIILGAAEEEAVLRRNSFQPTTLLTGDTEIAPGVEAIALPGHSAGFFGYVFTIDGKRHGFGADLITLHHRGPVAFFPDDLAEQGVQSLERLRDLKLDYWYYLKAPTTKECCVEVNDAWYADVLDPVIAKAKDKHDLD